MPYVPSPMVLPSKTMFFESIFVSWYLFLCNFGVELRDGSLFMGMTGSDNLK